MIVKARIQRLTLDPGFLLLHHPVCLKPSLATKVVKAPGTLTLLAESIDFNNLAGISRANGFHHIAVS